MDEQPAPGKSAASGPSFADHGSVDDPTFPEDCSGDADECTPERLRLWIDDAERRAEVVASGHLALLDVDVVLADPFED